MTYFKTYLRWIAVMVIFLTGSATSCEDYDEYGTRQSSVWNVKNNFAADVAMYTLYDNDGKMISARHLDSFVWLYPQELFTQESTRNLTEELERTPGLCIQFGLTDTELSPSEFNKIMLAYVKPDREWFIEHYGVIRFPEDCTVNPDLWQIFDLDEFVQQFGPLKARGWDEVWAKWEQSKQSL